jgi:hypothetical protein
MKENNVYRGQIVENLTSISFRLLRLDVMATVAPFHVLRQILEPDPHVWSTLLTFLQVCLLPTELASHLGGGLRKSPVSFLGKSGSS